MDLPWSKGAKTSHLRESLLLSHHEMKHLFKTTLKDTSDLVWFSFPVSQAFLLLSLYFVRTFLPPVKLHSIPVAAPSSHQHVGSIRFQKEFYGGQQCESTWHLLKGVSVEGTHWSPWFYICSRLKRSVNTKQRGARTLCNRPAEMKWWAPTHPPLPCNHFSSFFHFHLFLIPYVNHTFLQLLKEEHMLLACSHVVMKKWT